jgi:hypothetical protein
VLRSKILTDNVSERITFGGTSIRNEDGLFGVLLLHRLEGAVFAAWNNTTSGS